MEFFYVPELVKKSREGQTINSSQRRRQSYLRRKKIGAVLIEFAFAIPIFLVLIYYIHDLPKYKLMKRKMQFTSNIMAATIQNISYQKRGTNNPAITLSDLVNAMRLAFLTVYPGNTMVNTSQYHAPLGYKPHTYLYYVEGTGTNQASPKWLAVTNYDYRTSPDRSTGTGQWGRTSLKWASGASSDIHPDLRIDTEKTKIVLECFVFYTSNQPGYYFSPNHPRYPNESTAKVSPRDAFGFLMLNPPYHDIGSDRYKSNFFSGVTIFTPIDGAFNDTKPK